MRCHVFMQNYGYNTWMKLVRVAAVGKAENTTSDVHDIVDACYLFVFCCTFLKFPTFQRA